MNDSLPTQGQEATKPTDLAIVVAALGQSGEWPSADEIRGTLRLFGFDPSSQQVSAWLRRMTREDCPRFESREPWGGYREYRVTRFGHTEVSNRMPGLERADQ